MFCKTIKEDYSNYYLAIFHRNLHKVTSKFYIEIELTSYANLKLTYINYKIKLFNERCCNIYSVYI